MEIRGPARDHARADVTPAQRVSTAAGSPCASVRAGPGLRAGDRVELSEVGLGMAERMRASDPSDEQLRAERVIELRAVHRRGELHSDQRIETAAVRLLETPRG